MKQITGNLFNPCTYGFWPGAICITTNGFVKRNGRAVMGRGCALRAREILTRHGELDERVGQHINSFGNCVHDLGWYYLGPYSLDPTNPGQLRECAVYTFPVKDMWEQCASDKSNVVRHMQKQFKPGDRVPGWACKARLDIIERSARELVQFVDMHERDRIVVPRPGCGAGELRWNDVEALLKDIFDDRFYVITFPRRR